MSSRQPRRTSSEYSMSTGESEDAHAPIAVDDSDKSKARGHLYSLLFAEWRPRISVIPSFLTGAIPIMVYLIFGRIIDNITLFYQNGINPMTQVTLNCVYIVIIAILGGVAKGLDTFFWIRNGSYLSSKLRRNLFQNMMRSEVTFFDVNSIGGILTLLAEDSQMVQDAFGQTKGTQITNLAQFIVGIICAYAYSWKMALIVTATIPCITVTVSMFMPTIMKYAILKFRYVAESTTIAEETLASIRTVRGFNQEANEAKRYKEITAMSSEYEKKIGILLVFLMSLSLGFLWASVLGNLYFGATLVAKGEILSGTLFSVFGFTMFGCMGMIQLQNSLQREQKAITAGARIIKLSKHVPQLPFDYGCEIEDFKGHIEFRNVSFKYPTRVVYVLKNVSFEIKPNQMGALVGHSGSGKSTCVQLIERYYDATEGLVLLDGKDIREINPRWLHRQIALVSQEPTLFQMSVRDNIKYGAPDATDEEVWDAAEVANAKKFIQKMDHGLDQLVGEKGSDLSGGQRQRVAIARAIVKNPVILVTDEATSALDAGSEKKVQKALDKVMQGRTSVVVAHRLSTIRNANVIYVFDAGEIKEIGTHESLLKLHGFYYNLVYRQLAESEKDENRAISTSSSDPDIVKEEVPPPKESQKSHKSSKKHGKKDKKGKKKAKKDSDSDSIDDNVDLIDTEL